MVKRVLIFAIAVLGLNFSTGCNRSDKTPNERVMYTTAGGQVKTLDPALAADLASRNLVASVYDTLLQYNYLDRPYRLEPSMLAKMPKPNVEMTSYTFKLRDDLFFHDDPCFKGQNKNSRQITAHDVLYSFLRIADIRLHSPVFWIFRGRIKGIDEFRQLTAKLKSDDNSVYKRSIAGFEIIDKFNFKIHLNQPDPRFLYSLAIPYAAIVSQRAVEFYGEAFANQPVGSGPFKLTRWIRDYRIELERNPEYRQEFFTAALNPTDRTRTLPLLDKIICNQVKQPFSAWLLFLQGQLDLSTIDKENIDSVIGGGGTLVSALLKRGIKLWQVPEFEVRYIGFNFTDPILGRNLHLRRAISLVHDLDARMKHFNGQIIPANGPIPPGVAGFDEQFQNPWNQHNIEKARAEMVLAGYPDGIDPSTGKALVLTFDQPGSSSANRQLGEIMARDLNKIGIELRSELNNRPRFYQKLQQGHMQLFRLSWIGDYPDAENFLQLFYSKNAGGSNRVCYRDPVFDGLFEEIIGMADSQERTTKYREMAHYLTQQCPWIFESHPISFQLTHEWLENFVPHDFAFAQWKYWNIDLEKRKQSRTNFQPISFAELREIPQ